MSSSVNDAHSDALPPGHPAGTDAPNRLPCDGEPPVCRLREKRQTRWTGPDQSIRASLISRKLYAIAEDRPDTCVRDPQGRRHVVRT